MDILLLSGSANRPLAEAIALRLGTRLADCLLARHPDGEVQVELRETVRGRDVYVIQPTRPPVGEHLVELLLLCDAARRAGASRLTAVIPYFGYARQDRRSTEGSPLGARLMAHLLEQGGVNRTVALDLHSPAIAGCFGGLFEHVTAVPLLAERLRTAGTEGSVIVSSDLGAVKLAERFARILDLPVAVIHKHRLTGSEVRVRSVVGDVEGLAPILVDDMISTGGTVEAAVVALMEAGCKPEVSVAATHGLFVGPAAERLAPLPIRRIVVTDSVPAPVLDLPVETVGLADLLGRAVNRLHGDEPLAELVAPA